MTRAQEALKKEIEAIKDPAVIAKINDFIEKMMAEQEEEKMENKKKLQELAEECNLIVIKVEDGKPMACFGNRKDAEFFIEAKKYDEKEYKIIEASQLSSN